MANQNNIKKEAPYKIGLTLSGGGAKGIAHLGILQAMEELNIKPQIISGVSAGAIVGALYADGKSPIEIRDFFQESSFFKFVSLTVPKQGFMSSEHFHNRLSNYLSAKTFEELRIPLIVNATELIEGKNVYFSSGPLIDRIVASASVPLFLTPQTIDDKVYVDGGIFNNMPTSIIRDKCNTLIGVHVNPIVTDTKLDSIKGIFDRVYNLSIQSSTVIEKRICDLVIEPVKARNFGMFEISKTHKIFDIGYQAAMKAFEKWDKLKEVQLSLLT